MMYKGQDDKELEYLNKEELLKVVRWWKAEVERLWQGQQAMGELINNQGRALADREDQLTEAKAIIGELRVVWAASIQCPNATCAPRAMCAEHEKQLWDVIEQALTQT